MRSTHEAAVDAGPEAAWGRLPDAAVGAVLTEAAVGGTASTVSGAVRLRLGSRQITYRVTGNVVERDDGRRAATVDVTGKEARGAGTLTATLAVSLDAADSGSTLSVVADVEMTGRGEMATTRSWSRTIDGLVAATAAAIATPAPQPREPEPVATEAPPLPPPPPAPVTAAPPAPAPAGSSMRGLLAVAVALGLGALVFGLARRRTRLRRR